MIVEKRIAGIIRWLERLNKSYSSGAIESALMDAECARADFEDLRLAVWSKARPNVRANNSGWLHSIAYALPLSVIIVMMMVMPLSREAMPLVSAGQPEADEVVLAEPIIVVREEDPAPVARKASAPSKKQTSAKRTASAKTPASKPQPTKQIQASVAYDKVPYLLQTGQRALKNSSSVIKLGR